MGKITLKSQHSIVLLTAFKVTILFASQMQNSHTAMSLVHKLFLV